MDLVEFVERYRSAITALRERLGDDVCEDLLVYLDTGEEGLAVEFLAGNLIRRRLPVTQDEAASLRELLGHFGPAGDSEDSFYSALNDPDGTVAELTVVDEPSS